MKLLLCEAGSRAPGQSSARPARCFADAWLMRSTSTEGSPVHGESARDACEAGMTTARTPSIVTELSATFVERITLGWLAGETARSCSAGERSPCSGTTSRLARLASGSSARRATDFGCARKESKNVA